MLPRVMAVIVTAACLAGTTPNAARAGEREDLRQKLAAWLQQATANNKDIQTIAMAADRALADGKDFWLLLGGSFTPATREFFALTWMEELHVFELKSAQARAAGLAPSKALFGDVSGGTFCTRQSPRPFTLEHLKIDQVAAVSGDQPITGSVVCRSLGGQAKMRVALRVSVRTEHGTFGSATPLKALPADGVVKFTIEPINPRAGATHFGPTPVFVELIKDSEQITECVAVSNTLATLLDVEIDFDAYARSALEVMQEMVEVLSSVRESASARKAIERFTQLSVQNQYLATMADRLGPFTPEQDAAFERKYGARLNAVTQQLAAEVSRLEQESYAGSGFFDEVERSVKAALH